MLGATGGSSLRDSNSGSGGLDRPARMVLGSEVGTGRDGSQTSFNTWVHDLDLGRELVEVLHPGAVL